MIGHRDGHLITYCDTCYRIPPTKDLRRREGPERSVYARDHKGVEANVGVKVKTELHFCSDRCEQRFRAPEPEEQHA